MCSVCVFVLDRRELFFGLRSLGLGYEARRLESCWEQVCNDFLFISSVLQMIPRSCYYTLVAVWS